jgi:hypothetical protein
MSRATGPAGGANRTAARTRAESASVPAAGDTLAGDLATRCGLDALSGQLGAVVKLRQEVNAYWNDTPRFSFHLAVSADEDVHLSFALHTP